MTSVLPLRSMKTVNVEEVTPIEGQTYRAH